MNLTHMLRQRCCSTGIGVSLKSQKQKLLGGVLQAACEGSRRLKMLPTNMSHLFNLTGGQRQFTAQEYFQIIPWWRLFFDHSFMPDHAADETQIQEDKQGDADPGESTIADHIQHLTIPYSDLKDSYL
jgi:hypothetical protein